MDYAYWTKLNPVEWRVLITEGWRIKKRKLGPASPIAQDQWAQLYVLCKKAQDFALLRFGYGEIHNGRGDAVKHCYLSALLYKHSDEVFARHFMDAHEAGDPSNEIHPNEMAMDLFNNSIGRDIARQNPDASDDQLGVLCLAAVWSGRAKVLEGPYKNFNP